MKKKSTVLRRSFISVLCLVIIMSCLPLMPAAKTDGKQVTVLFTHDMHSHLEKFPKIKTIYNRELAGNEATWLVDAGDFSMGTPYQTIYTMEASELRMMGRVGFDVTTLGNHEFDYRAKGITKMLNAALDSGERLPEITISNIDWDAMAADSKLKDDAQGFRAAADMFGFRDYTVIEKGGVRIAFFGIFGKESDSYAPESGTIFKDQIKTAQATVDEIKKNTDADFIVCLSHSGTNTDKSKSEDEILAKEVDGIDVIISGHSHTYMYEPVIIGNTLIGSCGQYNDNIGKITLTVGRSASEAQYKLMALDDTVADDASILEANSGFRQLADEEYFSSYGCRWDLPLTHNDVSFTPIDTFGQKQGEDTLGNMIADSYIYGVMQAEGDEYETVDLAVAPFGVIRGSFEMGDITVADAFNALSLGTGRDGLAGYPLVSVYLTGKELKLVAEIDISISPLMLPARLYCSGLTYKYNEKRLILNRAYDIMLDRANMPGLDGAPEEIDDDRLYRVVADLYSAQMLAEVNSMSKGLLSLVPKDRDGNKITDYEERIIRGGDGKELKEWYALASYMNSFEGGAVPQYYASRCGRKVGETGSSPAALLKSPNMYFWIITAVCTSFLAIIVFIIILIIRKVRKNRLRA